jgi:hypothetical protein
MDEVQETPFLEGEPLEAVIPIGALLSQDRVGIELEAAALGVGDRVVDDELRALLGEKD